MYEYFIAPYSEKNMYLAGLIVSPALSADKIMFPICRLWPITYSFGKLRQKWPETFQQSWETSESSAKVVWSVCSLRQASFILTAFTYPKYTPPPPLWLQRQHTQKRQLEEQTCSTKWRQQLFEGSLPLVPENKVCSGLYKEKPVPPDDRKKRLLCLQTELLCCQANPRLYRGNL